MPDFLKGIPSLFVLSKDLYTESWRADVIESLVLEYHSSPSSATKSFPNDTEVAPPSAFLWVMYFLAQHFDFRGNNARALEWIDKAIEHTPTLTESYMIKAKILKHAGNYTKAMETMDQARLLDLQDRFVNTKATKYMLRANEDQRARDTVAMFTKVCFEEYLQLS
jgi:Tfp pilus assembly protein PilF